MSLECHDACNQILGSSLVEQPLKNPWGLQSVIVLLHVSLAKCIGQAVVLTLFACNVQRTWDLRRLSSFSGSYVDASDWREQHVQYLGKAAGEKGIFQL